MINIILNCYYYYAIRLGYSLFIELLTCNVPIMQEAASRWRKNGVDRGSWLTSESQRPISQDKFDPKLQDSMVTGMKSTPAQMSLYF